MLTQMKYGPVHNPRGESFPNYGKAVITTLPRLPRACTLFCAFFETFTRGPTTPQRWPPDMAQMYNAPCKVITKLAKLLRGQQLGERISMVLYIRASSKSPSTQTHCADRLLGAKEAGLFC